MHREELVDVNFLESVQCHIIRNGEKTLVGVCYGPPDSSKVNYDALFSLLNNVSQEKVIIMVD